MRTASRLFRKQGYHATGLSQITAESGAPRGSLYYYFPGGKEELAQEAIQLTGERIKAYISSAISGEADPVKAFQSYIQMMADGIEEYIIEETTIFRSYPSPQKRGRSVKGSAKRVNRFIKTGSLSIRKTAPVRLCAGNGRDAERRDTSDD
ncbi:helix-turn-helix domain containing protein [Bacillus licheniformis]|nr:helix-turn-helix domain containing protein [Bacillus licheniformis]